MRHRLSWLGMAVLLGVAACAFEPDLSRFPPCDAQGACPTGWTCLASEGLCLPDCGERGPCPAETPTAPPDTPDAGVPLQLEPSVLPVGTETASYLHTFQASGGTPPYTFSPSGPLPPGLSLDAQGALSGKPLTAGDYLVSLEVVDQGETPLRVQQEFPLRIRPVLRVAGPSILADAPRGEAYLERVLVTGGKPPYLYMLLPGSPLHAGLVLHEDGRVEGTTEQSGTLTFQVRMTDADDPPQVAERILTLTTRSCLDLCLRSRTLPDGRMGTAYSYALQTSANTGSIRWTLEGTLPSGLTFDTSQGRLSGTPQQSGTYALTVTASDLFKSEQVQLSLTVY